MIGQRLVQAESDEPTDSQINLSFAQQTSIMDDFQKKARQHEAHRNFGVDPRPSRTGRVAFRDCVAQLGTIENAIDADEDVVVWKEGSKRTAHEEFELIALLLTKHRCLR